MMSDPAPPIVVITGGHGGLGKALAEEFDRRGAEVHAPGRDQLDVTSAVSVDVFFSTLGRVDVLVNNAGETLDAPFVRMTETEFSKVLETNLKGTMRCSRAVARMMLKQRSGMMVNIASYSALQPPVGQANYAAAKAGVIGLTKSLAKELGARGVSVNAVLPGFLETKMTAGLGESARERVMDQHVLGRLNTPEEAARFIAELTAMTAVSGQVFQLDSRVAKW